MRLLVELSGNIKDWHEAFVPSSVHPRLPLPFSSSVAFINLGHEVSAIHLSDKTITSADRGQFRRLYGPQDFKQALGESDLALLWARSGINGVASEMTGLAKRKKIVFASYVWSVPRGVPWKTKALAMTTRLCARFARSIVLMTHEQIIEANRDLGGRTPVLSFTWGIDSAFYRHPVEESDVTDVDLRELKDLMRGPYVILAGDQQRMDNDAVELVEKFGIRLVRVPQERHTANWYRQQIRERRLGGRLFVFERVTYPTLRYLLQHARAYVGLVDSTWQPAGWTVLCEALASGLPVVIYDGLTAREILYLGAEKLVTVTPHQNVEAVASACQQVFSEARHCVEPAAEFSRRVLDLAGTAAHFVRCVEQFSKTS